MLSKSSEVAKTWLLLAVILLILVGCSGGEGEISTTSNSNSGGDSNNNYESIPLGVSSEYTGWEVVSPQPTTSVMLDLTYAMDMYVAVGTNHEILVSTDGIDWDRRGLGETGLGEDMPESDPQFEMVVGSDSILAVANSSSILTSTDGNNWSYSKQINIKQTGYIQSLKSLENTVYVVTRKTVFRLVNNGSLEAVLQVTKNYSFEDIEMIDNKLVVFSTRLGVSEESEDKNRNAYIYIQAQDLNNSFSELEKLPYTFYPDFFNVSARSNGDLLLFGISVNDSSVEPQIVSGLPGNWAKLSVSPAVYENAPTPYLMELIEINGEEFVYGSLFDSNDELYTFQLSGGGAYANKDIFAFPYYKIASRDTDNFAAIDGSQGSPYFSSDGFRTRMLTGGSVEDAFRNATAAETKAEISRIFTVNNRFFMYGDRYNDNQNIATLFSTSDMKQWKIADDLPDDISNIVYINNKFVAINSHSWPSNVSYSTDSINWRLAETGPGLKVTELASNGKVAVGVGESYTNAIVYTSNGTSWENAYEGGFDEGDDPYDEFGAVVWGDLRFLALKTSNGGEVFLSNDGAEWAKQSLVFSFQRPSHLLKFYDLIWTGSKYVALLHFFKNDGAESQRLPEPTPVYIISSFNGINWDLESTVKRGHDHNNLEFDDYQLYGSIMFDGEYYWINPNNDRVIWYGSNLRSKDLKTWKETGSLQMTSRERNTIVFNGEVYTLSLGGFLGRFIE